MTDLSPTTDDPNTTDTGDDDTSALGGASTTPTDDKNTDTQPKDDDKGDPKDDTTATDAKDGDNDDADAAGAPDKYDTEALTELMPDGVEFDTEGFEAVAPTLKELNLTQDQAGKLMGAYAEKIVPMIEQRTADQFDKAGAEMRANLARDLKADPEVGGAKYDESVAMAAKAIAHSIPDEGQRSEFSKFMDESGLGNHPLLMRIVSGYGRMLSESSTPIGGSSKKERTAAEVFYD